MRGKQRGQGARLHSARLTLERARRRERAPPTSLLIHQCIALRPCSMSSRPLLLIDRAVADGLCSKDAAAGGSQSGRAPRSGLGAVASAGDVMTYSGSRTAHARDGWSKDAATLWRNSVRIGTTPCMWRARRQPLVVPASTFCPSKPSDVRLARLHERRDLRLARARGVRIRALR